MVNLDQKNQRILEHLIRMEADGKLNSIMIPDLPIEVYHHPQCPGWSSTRIKQIVERNLNYAQIQFKKTKSLEFGSAFHSLMESDDEFNAKWVVGKHERGKTTLVLDEYQKLLKMRENVLRHPVAHELYEGSLIEHTYFSRCYRTGVLKKCRPDLIKAGVIGDWKTTVDASPSAFARAAKRYLYRISARYYSDIVSEVEGHTVQSFKFIAVESKDLHDVAVYDASDKSLEIAVGEIDNALIAISNQKLGGWTGYALNQSPLSI